MAAENLMHCYHDITETVDVPPVRMILSDSLGWCMEHMCERDYGTYQVAPSVRSHTIVSTDPFHLEPSVLCMSCGTHGFIRDGVWVDAGKTPSPLPGM